MKNQKTARMRTEHIDYVDKSTNNINNKAKDKKIGFALTATGSCFPGLRKDEDKHPGRTLIKKAPKPTSFHRNIS